jgi:hypothetical protein
MSNEKRKPEGGTNIVRSSMEKGIVQNRKKLSDIFNGKNRSEN